MSNVHILESDLAATLREIGPYEADLDINDDRDLVRRAREVTKLDYAYCSGFGWGNEERYRLTNKGRALLGLEPMTTWDRIKSFFA